MRESLNVGFQRDTVGTGVTNSVQNNSQVFGVRSTVQETVQLLRQESLASANDVSVLGATENGAGSQQSVSGYSTVGVVSQFSQTSHDGGSDVLQAAAESQDGSQLTVNRAVVETSGSQDLLSSSDGIDVGHTSEDVEDRLNLLSRELVGNLGGQKRELSGVGVEEADQLVGQSVSLGASQLTTEELGDGRSDFHSRSQVLLELNTLNTELDHSALLESGCGQSGHVELLGTAEAQVLTALAQSNGQLTSRGQVHVEASSVGVRSSSATSARSNR